MFSTNTCNVNSMSAFFFLFVIVYVFVKDFCIHGCDVCKMWCGQCGAVDVVCGGRENSVEGRMVVWGGGGWCDGYAFEVTRAILNAELI